MRISLYLSLCAIPLFFAGGISGNYFLKTLSVLLFVVGALGFLWSAIQHAEEFESEHEDR